MDEWIWMKFINSSRLAPKIVHDYFYILKRIKISAIYECWPTVWRIQREGDARDPGIKTHNGRGCLL